MTHAITSRTIKIYICSNLTLKRQLPAGFGQDGLETKTVALDGLITWSSRLGVFAEVDDFCDGEVNDVLVECEMMELEIFVWL